MPGGHPPVTIRASARFEEGYRAHRFVFRKRAG